MMLYSPMCRKIEGDYNYMEWNNIVITCTTIIGILGGVLIILNVIKAFRELRKPQTDVTARLNMHDEYLARDNQRIGRIENDTAMLLKSQYALMLHFTTGNSVENLKKKQEELLNYLAERK